MYNIIDVLCAWPHFSITIVLSCRDNFGELIVEVEYGKKENRTEFADEFTLSDFLDEYGNQDIYMVQDAFEEMYGN